MNNIRYDINYKQFRYKLTLFKNINYITQEIIVLL